MSRRIDPGGMSARRHPPPERPGPEGGRRDINRRKRTHDLVGAGLTLFLTRGLESVTIDEIALEAGMAKGSFYRYFADKADLVDALLAPTADRMRRALSECEAALGKTTPGASLSAPYLKLAVDLAEVVALEPQVVLLYLQERRAPPVGARKPLVALSDEILERATKLAQVALEHGLVRALDPRISALVVVGAVEELWARYLAGRAPGEVSEVSSAVISLILDGMRVR